MPCTTIFLRKLSANDEITLVTSLTGRTLDQPWLDRQRAAVNAMNDSISTLQASKDPFVIRALAEKKASATN